MSKTLVGLLGRCELRHVGGGNHRWRCTRCEQWGAPGQSKREACDGATLHALTGCQAVPRASSLYRRKRAAVALPEVQM